MPNYVLKANMSNVQWFGRILDRHIAPDFSSLTSFDLPDLAELPNYYGSFFLNNAFSTEFPDKPRPLIFGMLRRLTQATREYRAGREALAQFGDAKSHSNAAVSLYLRALTHFEQVVVQCDLAVALSHAVARCIDAGTPMKHFTPGDGSPEERLRHLYNALKHFDGTVVDGSLPEHATPVWIVSAGLRCILEPKKGQPPEVKTLQFTELATILGDLEANAKFLSETVYRLAQERRDARSAKADNGSK